MYSVFLFAGVFRQKTLDFVGDLFCASRTRNEEHKENDDEDEEQDFCDSNGRARDAGESEQSCDNGDNKENEAPFKHIFFTN